MSSFERGLIYQIKASKSDAAPRSITIGILKA